MIRLTRSFSSGGTKPTTDSAFCTQRMAKVSRDRLMVAMENDHPGYGFADHKGYSTRAHSAALNRLGPSSQHRFSFINVRRLVVDGEPGEHGELECGKMPVDTPGDGVLREGQLSR